MKKLSPLPFFGTAGKGAAPGTPTPGAGHTDEFRRLILPHLDAAYSFARFLTRDSVLSEDIVQDSILRAFRSFEQFRGGSAKAWLLTIVRNCARTSQTGAAGRLALVIPESSLGPDLAARMAEHPDSAPTPEEATQQQSEIGRVRAAIEAIPEPFREAVVLRDLEDLSYAEIAQATGVPVGTVMSRLSRGRAMLAAELLPAKTAECEPSRSVK
jgi:RNA polymerase sigma-70 factor (ECF subfamily)